MSRHLKEFSITGVGREKVDILAVLRVMLVFANSITGFGNVA
jgi:hypothetical protein